MENELIRYFRQRVPAHRLVELGLGDDAAVLRLGEARYVLTVDLLSDHVDFELAEVDPRRVGRKLLAVNLSDIAAMAARPLAAVIALLLPRAGGLQLAKSLYEGLLPLAEEYDLAIAGGDTNSWDGPLAASVTILGQTTERGPLTRSGARPGDQILVTGSFGGSILGKHLDFQPRVREALWLHQHYQLHAGIDCSDGLALDLARLAEESGCGAAIDLAAVPVAEDAYRLAKQLADGSTPLQHALADGEDFELILAVPPQEASRILADQPLPVPIHRIGQFIEMPGLWEQEPQGKLRPLAPTGWVHRL
ncbi:MAG: thiamine-phosphate kinase [Thermoguttaceae bacterium]|nr:thiamine-phosphate kinase [Thermoguttaceae bacterium]MDW8038754.1 thiamine-phosphate kinase [Thermoguttaceae bacterium]